MLGGLTNERAGSRNRWKSSVVGAARVRPSFCLTKIGEGVATEGHPYNYAYEGGGRVATPSSLQPFNVPES